MKSSKWTDERIEQVVSILLRTGVLIAGAVVFVGGIYYFARHASEPVNYRTFHGEPEVDRILHRIVAGAFTLRGRSIIQLGVVLLLATPIARVAVSLVGFALQRDWTYVLITAIVLGVLLYSLVGGALQG